MANDDVREYVQLDRSNHASRMGLLSKSVGVGVLTAGLVLVLLGLMPAQEVAARGADSLAALPLGGQYLTKARASNKVAAGIVRPVFLQQGPRRTVQNNAAHTTEVRGEEGTQSFRRFFLDASGKEMSPWHDMPLEAGAAGEYWMITEIPKMTRAKMEIATKEEHNPIAQDEKKGKLRDYHGPIFWNYGYLPQTWEDPESKHPELGVFGDNDPVDVVEIGSRAHGQGELVKVKVLGTLAMIDDGELDWKMIAIAADDPMASKLNDVSDIDKEMPGVTSGIREWFRWYKTPDGKPLNQFGFDEKVLDKAAAIEIIKETNEYWKKLRSAGHPKLWTR